MNQQNANLGKTNRIVLRPETNSMSPTPRDLNLRVFPYDASHVTRC